MPLLRAAQALPTDALQPARMSASLAKWQDTSVRGDRIGWVQLAPSASAAPSGSVFAPLHATAGWATLRDVLSQVVETLNREADDDVARGGGDGEKLRLPEKVMAAR